MFIRSLCICPHYPIGDYMICGSPFHRLLVLYVFNFEGLAPVAGKLCRFVNKFLDVLELTTPSDAEC